MFCDKQQKKFLTIREDLDLKLLKRHITTVSILPHDDRCYRFRTYYGLTRFPW